MPLRVLIIGGYGTFGARLAQLLADEPGLTLIIAGRSRAKAQAFCDTQHSQAAWEAAAFDRDGDVAERLRALSPDIVVDASGPFQDYGDGYRVATAALAQGISYLDLADGAAFVAGISQFDAAAKARDVVLLSGLSSLPALSSAVVSALATDLASVETVTVGIAPSPHARVGLSVVRAIASYAGRPVAFLKDGERGIGRGMIDSRWFTIAPPGAMPLPPIRFSLVDAPDLRVLRPAWPELKGLWLGAGPRPAILHRILSVAAHAVRFGLIPLLSWFAPLMHRVSGRLRWGEHRGGMFVAVEGRARDGTPVHRSWHLIAEGDDGPFIPSMAAAAIIRARLAGRWPVSGARPAVDAVALPQFEAEFAKRAITTGVRTDTPVDWPLFRRLLGPAWERLPAPVRTLHAPEGEMVMTGRASVTRGTSLASRIAGWLAGFPPAMEDAPVSVEIGAQHGAETWTRRFGRHTFASRLCAGEGRFAHLLCERFGPLAIGIALIAEPDRLTWVIRRWSLFGIPLPSRLAPHGLAFESAEEGRFTFDVEVRLPIAGLVVRYRGWLA